jgi:hypothetical protein
LRQIAILVGLLVAVGLAGCNNSKKDHSARGGAVTVSMSTTKQKVVTSESAELSAHTSGGNGYNYAWTQMTGPTATFPTGTATSTVGIIAPSSGPAGWMEFSVQVTNATGQVIATGTIDVLFEGVLQHTIEFKVNDNATGSDSVEATLSRLDGTPVTGKTSVEVEYTVTLTGGETHVRQGVLLPPGFNTITSFEVNNAGTSIDLATVASINATVRERGVALLSNNNVPPIVGFTQNTPLP